MRLFIHLPIFLCCLCLFLASCEPSPKQQAAKEWMQETGRLKVLSTTGMVGDIVRNVGGPLIDHFVLIGEELDPHSYQLVKGDGERIERADLVFYSGLNLEHGPSLQIALQKHPHAVSLGTAIEQQYPEKILYYGRQADPHLWTDASLWAGSVPAIVKALSEALPEQAATFAANGEHYQKEMLQAHEEVYRTLQSIPSSKRYLVTSHDAFNYFARAYLATPEEIETNTWQDRCAAPEGLAPDSQLSTSDIQLIINHLIKYNISVLFPESNVSKDSIRKIVSAGKEKGLTLTIAQEPLYGDAMGACGSKGDTYLNMIKYNAYLLQSYLVKHKKDETQ